LKRFLIELAKTTGTYVLVVVGGTVILLIISSFIGYLPYSDRPGPGWHGWRGNISVREILFFLSWAALGVIPGSIYGSLLFLSIQLLRWIQTPLLFIRALGAISSGFLSFYLILGLGWYIAIAAFPVYGAGVLGLLFGGWLLPRQVARTDIGSALGTKQRLTIFVLWCLSSTLVVSPFYTGPSCDRDQSLEVMFVQWRPGSDSLSVIKKGLTSEDLAHLKASGITTGELIVNSTFRYLGPDQRARSVIVMQRRIDSPVELPQPNGTNVIYLQEADGWMKIPSDAPTLRKTIRLTPGKHNPRVLQFEAEQECGGPTGGATRV